MTTREMVTNLMTECLGDATRCLAKAGVSDVMGNVSANAAAALAAAMFTARWERGSTRLVSAIHRAGTAAEADGPRAD